MAMKVVSTPLEGLLVLEPRVFGDARGFFLESWNARVFAESTGISAHFVQDNHSRSACGVLRGLHYQRVYPQGKLVRVTAGRVWDVAVDIREGSPTFSQHFGCELSAENHCQMWIPPGFAHGFLVLSESADFLYKTTEYWRPEHERALLWSDPALGIVWPFEELRPSCTRRSLPATQCAKAPPPAVLPQVAARDAAAPSLAALQAEGQL
jgi:dTDP-4-dehydrorhamnose 3,5-epimerase